MDSEVHSLVLTKLSERQLQAKVITKQLSGIIASVNNGARERAGWKIAENPIGKGGLDPDWLPHERYMNGDDFTWQNFKLGGDEVTGNNVFRYEMYLTISFQHDTKKFDKHYFNGICRQISTRATQAASGKWDLTTVDGEEYIPVSENELPANLDSVGYVEVDLPTYEVFMSHFTHLYGLDPNVKMAYSALETAFLTQFAKRYHTVFIGPPGCGKSDICHTIKKMLGEEAVIEFDCTAMTNAGAIKELTEREVLPRIVLFEEIEKAPESCTAFLLGMLDQRAEIRKTTARGSIQRDTKLYAIATVNNVDLFRKMAEGALASRFSNPVFFQRPTREQQRMILEREIISMQGDLAWADPALDYCTKWGIDDPRQVTALCLCGRDRWLSGEYQEMLAATSEFRHEDIEEWTTA